MENLSPWPLFSLIPSHFSPCSLTHFSPCSLNSKYGVFVLFPIITSKVPGFYPASGPSSVLFTVPGNYFLQRSSPSFTWLTLLASTWILLIIFLLPTSKTIYSKIWHQLFFILYFFFIAFITEHKYTISCISVICVQYLYLSLDDKSHEGSGRVYFIQGSIPWI